VPFLVVARAGAQHPSGMPASRSGCRKPWPCSVGPHASGYQCADCPAAASTPVTSGRGRAEPRAAGANCAKTLIEACPGPGLDLRVPRLGLGTCGLQVLEPCIGLFDLEQFSCELCIRHRHSLRVSGSDAILGPGPDGAPHAGGRRQRRRRAAPSARVPA
jgi:hypothetical protein